MDTRDFAHNVLPSPLNMLISRGLKGNSPQQVVALSKTEHYSTSCAMKAGDDMRKVFRKYRKLRLSKKIARTVCLDKILRFMFL